MLPNHLAPPQELTRRPLTTSQTVCSLHHGQLLVRTPVFPIASGEPMPGSGKYIGKAGMFSCGVTAGPVIGVDGFDVCLMGVPSGKPRLLGSQRLVVIAAGSLILILKLSNRT